MSFLDGYQPLAVGTHGHFIVLPYWETKPANNKKWLCMVANLHRDPFGPTYTSWWMGNKLGILEVPSYVWLSQRSSGVKWGQVG